MYDKGNGGYMRMNYAFCLSLLLSVMLEEHVKKERGVLSVDIIFYI